MWFNILSIFFSLGIRSATSARIAASSWIRPTLAKVLTTTSTAKVGTFQIYSTTCVKKGIGFCGSKNIRNISKFISWLLQELWTEGLRLWSRSRLLAERRSQCAEVLHKQKNCTKLIFSLHAKNSFFSLGDG